MNASLLLDPVDLAVGRGYTAAPATCTARVTADTLRQASDIMVDGSQEPNKICNGISIGIGFEAKRAGIGGVSAPQPALPEP